MQGPDRARTAGLPVEWQLDTCVSAAQAKRHDIFNGNHSEPAAIRTDTRKQAAPRSQAVSRHIPGAILSEPANSKALHDWAAANGFAAVPEAMLLAALTHKSYGPRNYERLEFLGDRVLGAAMGHWLFQRFPEDSEGQLTRRMAKLVSRETCARVARRIDIPHHVRLGVQARSDGGADSDNILGDVLEALIGALFLTAGMAAAEALVRQVFEPEITSAKDAPKHPKSAVQEWAAARALRAPGYQLLNRSGPHHNPRFLVELTVAHLPPVQAEGSSKQEAETLAATRFLKEHDA